MELEAICKAAGLKCVVKPFDQYQGPYAYVLSGKGELWILGQEGPETEFYFEYYVDGKLQGLSGSKEIMIDFLKELKKSGFKLKSQVDRDEPEDDQDW